MIQIQFNIQNNTSMNTKKIQFCKNHEKNMHVLYGIIKEAIRRGKKSDLEQICMISCFHIVKEIRKNTVLEIIENKLLAELFKHQNTLNILRDLKKISIEARIDNFPKKILQIQINPKLHSIQ